MPMTFAPRAAHSPVDPPPHAAHRVRPRSPLEGCLGIESFGGYISLSFLFAGILPQRYRVSAHVLPDYFGMLRSPGSLHKGARPRKWGVEDAHTPASILAGNPLPFTWSDCAGFGLQGEWLGDARCVRVCCQAEGEMLRDGVVRAVGWYWRRCGRCPSGVVLAEKVFDRRVSAVAWFVGRGRGLCYLGVVGMSTGVRWYGWRGLVCVSACSADVPVAGARGYPIWWVRYARVTAVSSVDRLGRKFVWVVWPLQRVAREEVDARRGLWWRICGAWGQ
ncbi:hypothetical protein EDB89DRAFT_1903311 [Lactarius sanguifluus]|nr:hypothetical protein EDB89DRAFT_1903311 [Lactarius sanguifluus]